MSHLTLEQLRVFFKSNFNGGGDPKNIGGLIGKIKPNGVLKKSFFIGYVFGVSLVGGIVGDDSAYEISNTFSIGTIVAENSFVGGISVKVLIRIMIMEEFIIIPRLPFNQLITP